MTPLTEFAILSVVFLAAITAVMWRAVRRNKRAGVPQVPPWAALIDTSPYLLYLAFAGHRTGPLWGAGLTLSVIVTALLIARRVDFDLLRSIAAWRWRMLK